MMKRPLKLINAQNKIIEAREKLKPLKQGDLSGLCNMYAVINAARYLFPEMTKKEDQWGDELESMELQAFFASRLGRTRFAKMYLEGDNGPLLEEMLVELPYFMEKRGRAIETAQWTGLESFVERYYKTPSTRLSNMVLIIGIKKPWEHYSVVKEIHTIQEQRSESTFFTMFDSDGDTMEVEADNVLPMKSRRWKYDEKLYILERK